MSKSIEQMKKQLESALQLVQSLEQKIGLDQNTHELQNIFKVTVEQMHEGIQILDRQFHYIFINDAAAKHGLKSKTDLLDRKMSEAYPGIENTDFFKVMKNVMTNRVPSQMENFFDYGDGRKCWFQLYIEPHPVGVLIRSIDITERKIVEEQYRHSQKMEAIGLLVGGIAHDFNNKLGVMTLFCEMALRQVSDEQKKLKGYIMNVMQAVQDSATLTKKLVAFGRKQVLDLRVIDMNDLISQIRDSLECVLGETIELNYHLASNLANMRVDWSQMDQVILNLCINSRDAMPNGGTLTIETANVELDKDYCAKRPNVIPGDYVMLSISDNGIGMNSEVQSRIFEPFYTTKEVGKGTGLGLSSVHGIVNQSRGHIWVYSEVGVGTTFKIYFPRVDEAKEEFKITNPLNRDFQRGTETILLVEDDPLLRQAFTETLQGAGYAMITASSAEEAEILFDKNKAKISLLLSDVILPKKGGRQLAIELKEVNPQLKVIFVSGYTENSIVHHGVLDEGFILLEKPITTIKLLSTIRQVLEDKLFRGVF
jgi:two-component system, cell cycle sensor histidine kinase and response regulator CckA